MHVYVDICLYALEYMCIVTQTDLSDKEPLGQITLDKVIKATIMVSMQARMATSVSPAQSAIFPSFYILSLDAFRKAVTRPSATTPLQPAVCTSSHVGFPALSRPLIGGRRANAVGSSLTRSSV